ncbi:DUF2512 family protein [Paenibacillus turpanensis]|uniref:DUF2512 family protein n=1 Tax=Paenibacillus turpanensis TaxID=2689078 RepID=UPI00140845E4|nr:DUF2512 family protein [Paenibacillus turpanensis]
MGKFFVKLMLNGIIAIPLIYWLSDATFWEAAIAAVALCVIAYILGDRMVLPATNNTIATIADFGLAFLFLWFVSAQLGWGLTSGESFLIAALIAVSEIWYHSYLGSTMRRAA